MSMQTSNSLNGSFRANEGRSQRQSNNIQNSKLAVFSAKFREILGVYLLKYLYNTIIFPDPGKSLELLSSENYLNMENFFIPNPICDVPVFTHNKLCNKNIGILYN